MGLFDKLLKTVPSDYTPKSEGEAWYAMVIACSSVDGEISQEEINASVGLLIFHPIMKGRKLTDYTESILKAIKNSSAQSVIDSSIKVVPEKSRTAVFIYCLEMIMSDGKIGEKEKNIIEYLTKNLSIPVDQAEKIIEVLLSKYRLN